MRTIKIGNTEYAMVKDRVKAFREKHPNWSIITNTLDLTPDFVVIRCTIEDENDRVISTGLAQENRETSVVNKSSYVENCETSAVGRALAFLGYGIDGSIASFEEYDNKKGRPEHVAGDPIGEGRNYGQKDIQRKMDMKDDLGES